ncbi:hypothetical protein [Dyella lutea]|uniref:Lipoprotein n=1 Tax=Dyella lutea TaxID=2950441 RepID=A0ABT1FF66_9GAMM|nr:hypothetical protein [Dyella lutea]MCP1376020.1 hypothetical protein [Dyella lutea]
MENGNACDVLATWQLRWIGQGMDAWEAGADWPQVPTLRQAGGAVTTKPAAKNNPFHNRRPRRHHRRELMRNRSLLLAIALLALTACTDNETAARALHGAGYSDVQLTGYRWIGCGKDDDFSTGFKAKGPTGVPVTGVVCSSWFGKGATVRQD